MRTYQITYTIRDGDNDPGVMQFWVTASDIQTDPIDDPAQYAQYLSLMVDDLITGVIESIHVTERVPVPNGLKALPAITSDVQEGVEWKWRSAFGGVGRFTMPTILETILIEGGAGKVVDTTLPAVAAFIFAFTHPIDDGGWTVAPVDYRGSDLVSLMGAKQTFG